jgi:outer membrane protein
MQAKINKIGLALLIANLLVLAGIGYYAFSVRNKKMAFIINQRVFSEFLGKKELEKRLNDLRAGNNKSVDSLTSLMRQANNQAASSIYQEGIDNIKLMEEQLSSRYTADIWKQINQWVNEYGKQKGFDFILGAAGNGSLMYANEGDDITEEVIVFLNKKYQGD